MRQLRFQITDVLTQENLFPNRQRDRVFQMAADGQQRFADPSARRHLHGQRGITTSTAQHHLSFRNDAHNGIIQLPHDGPIMNEESVRDSFQSFPRVEFIGANRFVAQISARRHHREFQFRQEQVVQRIRWQHDAEIGIARRDRRRERTGVGTCGAVECWSGEIACRTPALQPSNSPPFQQHNRRRGRKQQPLLQRRHFASPLHAGERWEQQRERFFPAMFSFSQSPHRSLVPRVHH